MYEPVWGTRGLEAIVTLVLSLPIALILTKWVWQYILKDDFEE